MQHVSQLEWEDSNYVTATYVGPPLTDSELQIVEEELGYKLPSEYIELARSHNGGVPRKRAHRSQTPTCWAADHIEIYGIFAIGHELATSLCGTAGSKFWITHWKYPAIGVYFTDCPSAGHDMVCLDYTQVGPNGEPRVVHVDQEADYKITPIANTFGAFVRGLQLEDDFLVP